MIVFEIKGEFVSGKTKNEFSKEIEAINEHTAKERVFAEIGSKHGCKRRHITIKEIKKREEK